MTLDDLIREATSRNIAERSLKMATQKIAKKHDDEMSKAEKRKCREIWAKALRNLSFLNGLARKNPLRLYLKTMGADAFPLRTTVSEVLCLKSSGVYTHDDYDGYKKITWFRLLCDRRSFLRNNTHYDYIYALARWDEERTMEYLGRQFAPISLK